MTKRRTANVMNVSTAAVKFHILLFLRSHGVVDLEARCTTLLMSFPMWLWMILDGLVWFGGWLTCIYLGVTRSCSMMRSVCRVTAYRPARQGDGNVFTAIDECLQPTLTTKFTREPIHPAHKLTILAKACASSITHLQPPSDAHSRARLGLHRHEILRLPRGCPLPNSR